MTHKVNAFTFFKALLDKIGSRDSGKYNINIVWDRKMITEANYSRKLYSTNRHGHVVTVRGDHDFFEWREASTMGRSHVVSIRQAFDGKNSFITVLLRENNA